MLDRPTFESLYSGQFTFINSVNKSIFCALVILPHYVILRIPENDVYALLKPFNAQEFHMAQDAIICSIFGQFV